MWASLIPIGISLASSLLNKGKKPEQPAAPGYGAQYQQAMQGAKGQGSIAETEYLNRAMNFNPQAAMEQSAQGAFNALRGQLAQDVGDLRGSQVGTGRIRTGFANTDEDRLVSGAYDRLNNTLAQNAMNAAQMQMQNTAQLGAFGQAKSGQYHDMLSGAMDREQAAKNAKAQQTSGLLGAGASILGSFLGGSGGDALGKGIASIFKKAA